MAYDIETKCLHLENQETTCDRSGAISFPIYQTATFAHLGLGKSTGYDYSRLQNPTKEQVEKIVAGLEGGVDAIAAPILSSVCVVSLLLSRIFLKEKLSWKTYAFIAVVIFGILLLAVAEEL